MEQKATIDAVYALALGLYTHVNPVPTVTGAPRLVKLLTLIELVMYWWSMNVEN
jgi:carbon-monoxide dehydrogenase catalytic subunit